MILFETVIKEKEQGETGETGGFKKKKISQNVQSRKLLGRFG